MHYRYNMRKDDLITVDGHNNLARDPSTGAILNINKSDIEHAREQKRLRTLRKQEEEQLKETVSELKKDMSEIKDLLSKITERL